MRTATLTLYGLGELGAAQRQRVLDEHRAVNVDDAWWEATHAGLQEDLMGLGLAGNRFVWDLDERSFCSEVLQVAQIERFLRSLGYPDLRQRRPRMLRSAWERGELTLATLRLSHRLYRNRLEVFTGDRDIDQEAQGRAEALLRRFEQTCLQQLDREFDYLTSDEAVIDTLIANGWEFTRSGRLWTPENQGPGGAAGCSH